MAHVEYSYNKIRKNFGRQPMFCMVSGQMLDSIAPNKTEQNNYILRNPVHRETEFTPILKEQYVNTTTVTFSNQGVNHAEGGWPKEINYNDEENTTRHRRRVERDETYIDAVLGTYDKLSKSIHQNNAIEMYDLYFKRMNPVQPVEKNIIRLNNMYKDKYQRQISSLDWTYEDDAKLVVAYCDKTYPVGEQKNLTLECSIWNLENPNEPEHVLLPPSPCWQAVPSPANPSLVIGGLQDGRVCIFDIRSQTKPVAISPAHSAHREPITALIYMQSRLNIEFFSGSTDGSCMWWDVRNISANTDYLIMSVRATHSANLNLANAEPVSALQFDKAFPTKFLCGTDTGMVICVNRKGKTQKEMMGLVYKAHVGPVKTVQRSPCITKMFITCGDWTSHIWSEDICTSPIITGNQAVYQINDVTWAPQRFSSYMTVSADGVFRFWDLLRKYREPTKSLLLCKVPLLKLQPHPDGRLVAVGDAKGNVYNLSLSQNLAVSADTDKQRMLQIYERENRREYILEARVKEIRLKQTTAEVQTEQTVAGIDENAVLVNTEEEYKKMIAEEIRRTGYDIQSGVTRKSPRQLR